MATRRTGRILAFQSLYAWEVSGESPADFSWLEGAALTQLDEQTARFSRFLVAGTIENIAVVDSMIRKHLENWIFSRVKRVDLALLRLSTYTLMFQSDIPATIVINEAVGIAQDFGTDESYRFINGVLDSIRKTLEAHTLPNTAAQSL
ncbi:MAG: transcription antitermination factor NusB [Treponema sp.]|jgi:N utilization substance protein B|nr:transcription antitermination factor NusB [Treponema sp.]